MGDWARRVMGIGKGPTKGTAMQSKSKAYEIRAVNDIPYFQGFLKQLEAVAQKPVGVGNHAEMIREILAVLRKDLETAERFVAGDQARQRQS
jgi:hypothetical protein